MMFSTWTAQFLILDCTNCILDCTNWLDCTLRISPGTKLQDITPRSEPLQNWNNVRCRFILQERGFWTRGYVRGVYFRQSWNLAFKSAMCDSVDFIRSCHWTKNSDLGELCPGGYVRSPVGLHRRVNHKTGNNTLATRQWTLTLVYCHSWRWCLSSITYCSYRSIIMAQGNR